MESSKDFMVKNLNLKIEKFVLLGASKLGWTAFLVAAMRPQEVGAIIPLVIPVLDLKTTFDRIHSAYCFWPQALRDCKRKIFNFQKTKEKEF
jgi:PhoPQ-activated pathogenicity-related protein